jgi:hypothetical protein
VPSSLHNAGSEVVDTRERNAQEVQALLDAVLDCGAHALVDEAEELVSDPARDELFAGLGLAVAVDLVLVDVARRDEVVADLEPGVRPLGGLGVGHEVVEGRVHLREAAVGLLAEVLDADSCLAN